MEGNGACSVCLTIGIPFSLFSFFQFLLFSVELFNLNVFIFYINLDLVVVQLIATATLFLAAKSEDTPRSLNNVLQASSDIIHQQNYAFSAYLPVVSILKLVIFLYFFLFILFSKAITSQSSAEKLVHSTLSFVNNR